MVGVSTTSVYFSINLDYTVRTFNFCCLTCTYRLLYYYCQDLMLLQLITIFNKRVFKNFTHTHVRSIHSFLVTFGPRDLQILRNVLKKYLRQIF